MTSKELIALLLKTDPEGVMPVRIWDGDDEYLPVTGAVYDDSGGAVIDLTCFPEEQEPPT